MDFFDLIEQSTIEAIQSALEPNAESIYRIKCRQYSTQFFTPLKEVYDLDPTFVLRELAEDLYKPSEVREEPEEILEKLYKIQDPAYERMSAQETEDLVDAVLNHELKRKGKKKEVKENTSEKNTIQKEKSKSGGMTFSDLDKQDSLVEKENGFKD